MSIDKLKSMFNAHRTSWTDAVNRIEGQLDKHGRGTNKLDLAHLGRSARWYEEVLKAKCWVVYAQRCLDILEQCQGTPDQITSSTLKYLKQELYSRHLNANSAAWMNQLVALEVEVLISLIRETEKILGE